MSDDKLRCERCERDHQEVPIIEKPLRFCLNAKVVKVPQLNRDGRKQDNVCLACLQEIVKMLR